MNRRDPDRKKLCRNTYYSFGFRSPFVYLFIHVFSNYLIWKLSFAFVCIQHWSKYSKYIQAQFLFTNMLYTFARLYPWNAMLSSQSKIAICIYFNFMFSLLCALQSLKTLQSIIENTVYKHNNNSKLQP